MTEAMKIKLLEASLEIFKCLTMERTWTTADEDKLEKSVLKPFKQIFNSLKDTIGEK